LDNRITELFLGARSAQLTWEEWRSRRAEPEVALEALISAIRREFACLSSQSSFALILP
jgi:hypothetical protein